MAEDDTPPTREHKKDPHSRPDRPTPSDDATLSERGEGANQEFSEAPSSLSDPPPYPERAEDEDDEGGDEQ